PAEIAHRRAAVLPAVDSPTSTMTAAIAAGTATSPLPGRLPGPLSTTPTSQVVVHASGSVPAARKKGGHARGRTLVALLLVLLLAGGGGGWWWWSQYGPGSYIDMPVVAGRNASAATSDLQSVGLASTTTEEFSDTVAVGVVIDSDPPGGQSVHKDVEVALVVSKGVDMRTVPDVVGDAEADARTALTDAGLAVGDVSQEYSEDVHEGLVISQSEEADTRLPHDTRVDLVVSLGREPIPVPDLSGKSSGDAAKALTDLGLVSTSSEAFSDTVAAGTVISQSTAAGSTLHRGDPVVYVVSKGPEMVQVPDVIGKQLEEAQRLLEEQGFQVSVERILGGYFGTVRQTDPPGGESIPKGSTVTITVI
ncbi:MAG: PASTA domain-containing protein, partial [Pauljensenia sp.]